MNQNMISLRGFIVSLIVCLVSAGVDANLDVFKKYQDEVFRSDSRRLQFESVRNKIDAMLRMIENGSIPIEQQGDETLVNLKMLVDDCTLSRKCNLEVDLPKLERLGSQEANAPNLQHYLQTCRTRVQEHCAAVIYDRIEEKLGLVGEKNLNEVDELARQIATDVLTNRFRYKDISDSHLYYYYHPSLLRALSHLYPSESKRVLKRRMFKERALIQLMDKIRQSCIIFLKHIDPIVELYPIKYALEDSQPMDRLSKLHYCEKNCRKIVMDWNMIVKHAIGDYVWYLIDPKAEHSFHWIGAEASNLS